MTIRFFPGRRIPSKKKLFRFARKICRSIKTLQQHGEICIVFVSNNQIKKLNRIFFQKNRATDVIAFPYFSHGVGVGARKNKNFLQMTQDSRLIPQDEFQPFGDIYICLNRARRQAGLKHPVFKELALLIAHGLLHLAGFSDATAIKKRKMFQAQKKLFLNLAPTLAPPDILK